MLETDESYTHNIVEDNYTTQVMSASLEYLGQNLKSVLHTLRMGSSLRKGSGKTPRSVLYTLRKA